MAAARLTTIVAAVALLTASTASADRGCIYFNDFEDPHDQLTEWSNPITATTPGSAEHPPDRFLGMFGEAPTDAVRLELNDCLQYSEISIGFDLYVINSWDGNHSLNGPDLWGIRVIDGPTLLHTSFFHDNQAPDHRQSYPGWYPEGDYLGGTGCLEWYTLGYDADAVYSFPNDDHVFSFVPWAETHYVEFYSELFTHDAWDEAFGIDNVCVTPEPAGLSLLALGLVALGKGRR